MSERHHQASVRRVKVKNLEVRAWELKAQGYSGVVIGERLAAPGRPPLSPSRVSALIRQAESRMDAEILIPAVRSVRAQQIARFEHIYIEAMTAWRKSQTPRKAATKSNSRRAGAEGDAYESTSQHVSDREGDVRFLETAMRALEGIRKLTGADAPIGIRVDGDVHIIGDVRLDLMEPTDVQAYMARLATVAGILGGTVIDADVVDGVAIVRSEPVAPSAEEGGTL